MDGAVVADVAGHDPRVGDAGGSDEVVMLDRQPPYGAQANKAGELAIADDLRSEWLGYANEAPVRASVAVFDEDGKFRPREAPIGGRRAAQSRLELRVAYQVFVLARLEKVVRDETRSIGFRFEDTDIVHRSNKGYPLVRCGSKTPWRPGS